MRLILGFGLVFLTVNTQALGVSEIELNSYLNQKLDASIELQASSLAEINSLSITLSPKFTNGSSVQKLLHEIVETDSGHLLKITSADVIREPILNFELDMNWQNGRLVREYSLLIDPPK
jgi:pilus assembly protein FimV